MGHRDEQQRRRPDKAPQPERRDWRRKNNDPDTATSRKVVKGWFRTGQSRFRYSRYRRLLGLGIGLATLLLVLCAWFYVVSQTHLQVPLLTVVVTEYDSAILPPNGFALEDEERFNSWFKRDRSKGLTRNVGCIPLVNGKSERRWDRTQLLDRLEQELGKEDLEPGGPSKDTIMLYVSAHGAVNDKGEACLLMSDADPLDSSTWLTVETLLKVLRKPPKFVDCKWLVFLDASRTRDNWQMGLLYNDFADRLTDLVANLGDKRLVVISAARAGQVGWVNPKEGGTYFGQAVAYGLSGAARDKGWLKTRLGLGRIRLDDLRDDLQTRVTERVKDERASTQEPIWCWSRKEEPFDWKIADMPLGSPANLEMDSPDAGRTLEQATRVAKLWREFEELAEDEPYLRDPLKWAVDQARLLRLEQLALAGKAYAGTFQDECPASMARNTRPESLDRGASAGASVEGVSERPPREHVATSIPLMKSLLRRWPDVVASQPKPAVTDAAGAPPAEAPKPTYSELLDVATNVLQVAHGPTPDDMDKVLQELAASRPKQRAIDPVEIEFARLIAGGAVKRRNGTWGDVLQKAIGELLRVRFQAERAAAPEDPRAVAWISRQVIIADQERRRAEDTLLMFEAEQDSAENLSKLVSGVAQRYDAAATLGEKMSEAFRVRDRSYMQLTGLAHWALHRPPRGLVIAAAVEGQGKKSGLSQAEEDFVSTRTKLLNRVFKLVKASQDLSDILAAPNDKWEPGSDDFNSLIRRLGELVDNIEQERMFIWEDYWSYVADVGDELNADALQQCDAFLRSPCGGGRSGRANNASRGTILVGYARRLISPLGFVTKNHPATDDVLKVVASCGKHPVMAMLRQVDAAPNPDPFVPKGVWDFRKDEQLIRQQLGKVIPQDVAAASHEAVRQLNAADGNDLLLVAGIGLEKAEERLRATLSLAATERKPDVAYAPALAQDVAVLRLFLWHRLRTLDDCYLLSASPQSTYVSQASQGYGLVVEEQWQKLRGTIPRNVRRDLPLEHVVSKLLGQPVNELAERRENAKGIVANSQSIRLDDRDDDLVASTEPEPVPYVFTIDASSPTLPEGHGFWELRHANTRIAIASKYVPVGDAASGPEQRARHELETPVTNQTIHLSLDREQLRDIERLDLVTYFRGGCEFRTIDVEKPGTGLTITYPRPNYDAPKVTVNGDNRKPVLIMIVLDCSDSMKDTLTQEESEYTKMDRAIEAFDSLLERLVVKQEQTKGTYRVGLILFGHRANYTKSGNSAQRKPVFANIDGNTDVERVFSLSENLSGELKKTMVKRVRDEARPYGQTPLYLALKTAVAAFDDSRIEEASAKYIVAITDGINQTVARPGFVDVTKEEVMDLAKSHPGLRLDIVGLGFDELRKTGSGVEKAGVAATEKLTKAFSEGDVHPASEFEKLRDLLYDAVKPWDVVASEPGVTQGDPPKFELGKAWTVPDWAAHPRTFRFVVRSPWGADATHPFEANLEGGEHLQLVFDGKQIVNARVEYTVHDKRENVNNGKGTYYVDAEVPEWKASDLAFRVQLHMQDRALFSPRPKRVWAEISPVTDLPDGSRPVFHFYDLEFDMNRPVPVLLFRTRSWPDSLAEAQIRFWAAMTDVEPERFDWQSRVQSPFLKDVVLETRERIDGKTGEHVYIVTEIYDDNTPPKEVPRFRVQLAPPPKTSVHEIRANPAKPLRVRHEFRYAPGEISMPPQLLVTRKEDICRDVDVEVVDNPIKVNAHLESRGEAPK